MPQYHGWLAIKPTWFSNLRGDLLAGIVVALALLMVTLVNSPLCSCCPLRYSPAHGESEILRIEILRIGDRL